MKQKDWLKNGVMHLLKTFHGKNKPTGLRAQEIYNGKEGVLEKWPSELLRKD